MQAHSFEAELRELQRGLGSVVEAFNFLKGFIESEYGMRFQFQAFKATVQNHERISNELEDLRNRYLLQQHSFHKEQFTSAPVTAEAHASTSTAQYSLPHSYSYAAGNSSITSDTTLTQQATIHLPGGQQNLQSSNDPTFNVNAVTVKDDNDDTEGARYEYENEGNFDSADMSEEEEEIEQEPFTLDPKTGKLTKRRKPKLGKDNWARELAKRKRMRGEAYTGLLKVEREDGKKHFVQIKPVHSRKLGPPCSSKQCEKSSNRLCSTFPENIRQMIFKQFWRQMDWEQKKAFVAEHCERTITKKPKDPTNWQKETFRYFLPINGEKRQICAQMMISTLGISKKMLPSWIKKMLPPPPIPEPEPVVPKKKYVKKSERMPKKPRLGSKCPYCLEIFYKRTEFQVHMANHMSQLDTGGGDSE